MTPSDESKPVPDNRSQHRKKIEALLREKREDSVFGLNKSTSNLFRHRETAGGSGQGDKSSQVDLSGFNQVVSVDSRAGTAEIEGMATYESIVKALLPLGFMPPVVPELKTITIGGALTGVGIESSSFKFGLVHESMAFVDVLTAEGEVKHCTPDNEHRDLFYGFPNSYGTLGYALKVGVPLVKTKPYVKLQHVKHSDPKAFFRDLKKRCGQKDAYDFVDGTVFGAGEMVITLGTFCDEAPYTSDYTFENIYYKSLQTREEDYLTVHDYIWRWDTDWFWCSSHFLAQNKWVRKLYGKERLRSTTYWKIRDYCSRKGITNLLDKVTRRKEAVIQDVEIPLENAEAFLDFFHLEIGILPVWVCPTHPLRKEASFTLYEMDPDKLYVNFGFWDTVPTQREEGYFNRKIEQRVEALGGKKSLYSDSYYNEEKFWKLYNEKAYRQLKAKYDPRGRFKDLYTKCVGRR